MFKWVQDSESAKSDNDERETKEGIFKTGRHKSAYEKDVYENMNTILKGSKLIGNINVTCDLELSGDVEGNITSERNSNIVIKGLCKGNIETKEGSVHIEGELKSGNITAGGNVKITGKFNGGKVKSKGRVYLNGEFKGDLEGDEIEIGSHARGEGQLHYRECISIAKGARVDVQINQIPQELKLIKTAPEKKAADIKPPKKEAGGSR